MKIAIIDSGINRKFKEISLQGVHYSYKNNCIVSDTIIQDKGMHGTLVYYTTSSMIELADYYHVKVLDNKGRSNSFILLYALEKLLDIDCDIINISMSTTNMRYFKDYNDICSELEKQNKLIVASGTTGEEVLPAMLNSVIGVVGTDRYRGEIRYYNDLYECETNNEPEFIFLGNNGATLFAGTSKGAGIVSGSIARLMRCMGMPLNKKQFVEILKEKPIRYDYNIEEKNIRFEEYIVEQFGKNYSQTLLLKYRKGLDSILTILAKIEKDFPNHRRIYLDDFRSEDKITELVQYGWLK
ncbi:MAG: hypothetical protein IK014_02795 [Lachnospiraceae bacterium]|nr:hypothetical protein [Lachnospiraceae bacterium]